MGSKIRLFVRTYKQYLILFFIVLIFIPLGLFLIKNSFLKPKTITPKIHTVTKFDRKTTQSLAKTDILTGKGIPNSKVSITISPGGDHADINTDNDGNWSYKIPSKLQTKNYNLAVIIRDINDNIASIKTYKVKVTSQGSSTQSNIPDSFIKIAYAQSNLCSKENQVCLKREDCNDGSQSCQNTDCILTNPSGGICLTIVSQPTKPKELEPLGSEYNDWLAIMHKVGVYPAKDTWTGEIVYVSREEYESEVCTGRRCTPSPDYDAFVNGIQNNNIQYILALGHKLRETPNCYIPTAVLPSYFPDASEFFDPQKNHFIKAEQLDKAWPNCSDLDTKRSIEENELASLINDAANKYALDKQDPFRDMVVATDGFFSTSIILKLYAQTEGYKLSGEDTLNTGFAIASILPPAKVGGVITRVTQVAGREITSRTVLELNRASSAMGAIRRAISQGERVSQEAVTHNVAGYLNDVPVNRGKFFTGARSFPSRFPRESGYLWRSLSEAAKRGKAWSLPPETAAPIMEKLIQRLESLTRGRYAIKGITLDRNRIFESINNGWIVVVDDNEYISFFPEMKTAAGFANGRTVVLPTSTANSANFNFILSHEFTHVIATINLTLHPPPRIFPLWS